MLSDLHLLSRTVYVTNTNTAVTSTHFTTFSQNVRISIKEVKITTSLAMSRAADVPMSVHPSWKHTGIVASARGSYDITYMIFGCLSIYLFIYIIICVIHVTGDQSNICPLTLTTAPISSETRSTRRGGTSPLYMCFCFVGVFICGASVFFHYGKCIK